ncbi:MAG: acetyl-CoA carboxylase biotin carboxylase subunit [Gemmatimonadetes bacterium]|nr:acetyl-CoA carboxylase biotin carboxylase subunit [Gemmatimonadota bacterium]
MFTKLLVANRGEIALRIIRACRELGVQPVAVYSEADRLSPHVLEADEAYLIGPAPSAESYLRTERLLEVALRCGAEAVHPGYGFLAERAEFAAAVEAAGLVFIGPSASSVAAMGDKTEARRRMIAAGVPVVPGGVEPLETAAAAAAAALELGYPVLLKAVAGGGGKGMRVVHGPAELPRALAAARREAVSAFGDAAVYLEKLLEFPRHIEIQVLADAQGHTVHLGERECSIQRRHQKLIEEAPSPVLSPELRQRMGQAAIAAAEAVGYRNAGTVEFLVQEGAFYFLEMNTRIQVEHPVTELVTGVDLVQWQLRIAAGERIPFRQQDIEWAGHAIECRITSEDPLQGFLPSTGRIELLQLPAGPGVRWDGGITQAYEVSLYYDPLLGKLVVHAPTRALAIERMRRALAELRIVGVETSTPFHRRVMEEPDFRAGNMDIRYLERHPGVLARPTQEDVLRAGALAAALLEEQQRERRGLQRMAREGPAGDWRERGWRQAADEGGWAP